MKTIVVTGASGRLGLQVVKELLEHGYEAVGADRVRPQERICRHVEINFNHLGEVYGLLRQADAVIHLAAIPAPGGQPNEVVYGNNVMSAYNVLEAAAGLGIGKAVMASSISAYGMAFSEIPLDPLYVPLDENHPLLARDAYGLSKIVVETMARSFHLRTGMQVVSMRLASVFTENRYRHVDVLPEPLRKRILWSYVDYRDAARACRLAVEADGLGAPALNIADDITCADEPSLDLMRKHYPDVADVRDSVRDYRTLLDNTAAKRLLNWQPAHHWRQYWT